MRTDQVQQGSVDTTMIRAELSVLADDVLRLEAEVVLHEAARNDFESALHRYRVAQAAIEQYSAGTPIDLARVQRGGDEAMWSMSRAKAITQGHPPPPPPPVLLQSLGSRGQPAVRLADDDQPMYIDAPVSFRSGWFGGGGVLGGLMLGSMMGGLNPLGGWMVDDPDSSSASDDVGDEVHPSHRLSTTSEVSSEAILVLGWPRRAPHAAGYRTFPFDRQVVVQLSRVRSIPLAPEALATTPRT